MKDKQCFAINDKGKCGATAGGSCAGYGNCPLYKPRWLQQLDLKQAHARLRALPEDTQMDIAEKYYRGKMPWRGKSK